MNALSFIGAAALRLVLGVQVDAVETDRAADAMRVALDARDYRRAELLLDELAAADRSLHEARLRFEVGDFVGCSRVAAAALPTAPAEQQRELVWWGAKAALWLQDAAGAEAWTARLAQSSAGDAAWESVARDYTALADELARGDADERRALRTSHWAVAIGAVLAGAISLATARRSASS